MNNPIVIERMVENMEIRYDGGCSMKLTHVTEKIPFGSDMKVHMGPELTETLKMKFPMIFKFTLTKREDQDKMDVWKENSIKIMELREILYKTHWVEEKIKKRVTFKYSIAGWNMENDLRFEGVIESSEKLSLELFTWYDVLVEQVVT